MIQDDYKFPSITKLDFQPVKSEDIKPIDVPKYTMEDYRVWERQVFEMNQEVIEKLRIDKEEKALYDTGLFVPINKEKKLQ